MMRDEACPLPQASATAAEATPIAPVGWLRRAIRHVSIAAGITSAALIMRMPGAVMPAEAATPVATKSKTTTGMKMKKRKSGGQEVGWATVGMCGGLTYWSMRVAKKEDDEEEKRIKEETEKMERMAKEFKDVDGEVTVDADLLASLKKRMNATASDGDDAPPPDVDPVVDPEDGDSGDDSSSGGGGSAVLERPSEDAAPPESGASEADIERLKRMFGSSPEE